MTNGGTILNCYQKGNITIHVNGKYVSQGIGGIVVEVEQNPTIIKHCYNLGNISVTGISAIKIGAILGSVESSSVTAENNYYSSEINITDTLAKGKAILPNNMKTNTFVNILNTRETYTENKEWNTSYIEDEKNMWVIKEDKNNGYPILKWQTKY